MRSSHRSKPTRTSKWSSSTAPSKASSLRTTISLRDPRIQPAYHLDRQGCNHCPTCWYGLVVPRWCRLHRSGDAPPVSEVSLPWPATCVSRAAKKLSCPSGKWEQVSCLEVDQWPVYLVSWEEDAHWKCCWARMTFLAISPNDTDTSTGHSR